MSATKDGALPQAKASRLVMQWRSLLCGSSKLPFDVSKEYNNKAERSSLVRSNPKSRTICLEIVFHSFWSMCYSASEISTLWPSITHSLLSSAFTTSPSSMDVESVSSLTYDSNDWIAFETSPEQR